MGKGYEGYGRLGGFEGRNSITPNIKYTESLSSVPFHTFRAVRTLNPHQLPHLLHRFFRYSIRLHGPILENLFHIPLS